MSATYILADTLLDSIFSDTVYLALSTTDPGLDGSGLVEPTGANYARKTIPSAGNWSPAANGSKTNASVLTTNAASAGWGDILFVAFMNAPTGGDVLLSGYINGGTPLTVESGDSVSFDAGAITITAG